MSVGRAESCLWIEKSTGYPITSLDRSEKLLGPRAYLAGLDPCATGDPKVLIESPFPLSFLPPLRVISQVELYIPMTGVRLTGVRRRRSPVLNRFSLDEVDTASLRFPITFRVSSDEEMDTKEVNRLGLRVSS